MTSQEKIVIQAALHWKAVFCFEEAVKASTKRYQEKQRELEGKASDRLFEAVEELERERKPEEPEDHDCHLSPDDGCQVCLDAVEREQEARAKEERKHGTA